MIPQLDMDAHGTKLGKGRDARFTYGQTVSFAYLLLGSTQMLCDDFDPWLFLFSLYPFVYHHRTCITKYQPNETFVVSRRWSNVVRAHQR